MTSPHFVSQYFTSFSEDPILKSLEKESEADVDEKLSDGSQGYEAARECLKVRNGKGSYLNRKNSLITYCYSRFFKTRTTNVVRNAGCAHSRYTLKIFFNQLMNQ